MDELGAIGASLREVMCGCGWDEGRLESEAERLIVALKTHGMDIVPVEDEYVECESEMHTWTYGFSPEAVDSYYMRCDLTYPHDEHKNSHTGAKWRDATPAQPVPDEGGKP